ncbi:uncharacterized protein LOC106179464 isoform X1 [Lingula anatina]|uniref:Uncharacterized protein LOC106179464 isoform X1 n=1 Tax=Lingula anatina TaxID=7574 RepID=A0A1S3K7Y1_LINAN|nr:uncharacterized protein LOC106179464 isoform X1 [Lingula anatina]|eukprot:XP_013418549.1 uncharacterized protein LOC106179464 isoform X1 [Lingula anatina]
MGGCKSILCNSLARDIILWCKARNIWLTAAYLPGSLNIVADRESRVFHDDTEWMLDIDTYRKLDSEMPPENCPRQGDRDTDSTMLEDTGLVSKTANSIDSQPSFVAKEEEVAGASIQPSKSSIMQQSQSTCMPLVRDALKEQQISEPAINIIPRSWRDSSHKQYRTYLTKWQLFCSKREINSIRPPIGDALDFLVELFHSGLSYSALNTARSALSAVLIMESGIPFGAMPIVKRFIKAVYQSKPPSPRYHCIWDVKVVLDYLCTLPIVSRLSLKDLTLKLIVLMALTSAQWGQTLHLLNTGDMHIGKASYTFTIHQHIKQSRPRTTLPAIKFSAYPVNKKLCVVNCLSEYLLRTQSLRKEGDRLFVSYTKPHGVVGRETVSRWIKVMLARAGIDITIFKAHSTRAAATSAAFRATVPLEDILNKAGWSNASTFARFYNKPIVSQNSFSDTLLRSINTK